MVNKNNKTLVQINSVCNGSTGKIMGEIQKCAEENGYKCISFYGRRRGFKKLFSEKINSEFFVYIHGILTLLFNHHGRYSYFQTKRLVKKIKKINPDIIQLHNVHGYYLNYKVLFKYLKNNYKGKIFWTLHDCWPFTGHCAYFTYAQCDKWKIQCYNCPQKLNYPCSLLFDSSKSEYNLKKELFTDIKNLTFITPSKWLKDLVSESYLKKYHVEVINNGIDLNIFKNEIDYNIKDKYNIPNNKKILLGVSNIWEKRKGFDTFIKIANDFKHYDYVFVLVGLSKKQIKQLPENVVGIERTDNQNELVKIYSIADVFVNPTLEDNYPTVNIEAIACGTPVVTYGTGGCREQVDGKTGFVCYSYNDLLDKIIYCIDNDYKKNFFDNRDILYKLDSKYCYDKYIKLYNGSDVK